MSDPIEALKAALDSSTDEQEKIDTMNDLVVALLDRDPEQALTWSHEAEKLARIGRFEIEPYQKGLALSQCHRGQAHLRLSNYDQAQAAALAALQPLELWVNGPEALEMKVKISICYQILFEAHKHQKNFEQGLLYLEKLRAIQEEIVQSRLAKLEQDKLELQLLHRLTEVFNTLPKLAQVIETVLRELHDFFDIVATSFWLYVPDTQELVCQHATGPGHREVVGWRLGPGQGLASFAAQSGRTQIVPDTWADDRHYKRVDEQTGLILRSIVSVPIQTRRGVLGVINLVDTELDRFLEDDLNLLEPIAAMSAIAIENSRLVTAVTALHDHIKKENKQ